MVDFTLPTSEPSDRGGWRGWPGFMLLAAFCLLGAGVLEVMALIPDQGSLQPMLQTPALVAPQIVLAAAFVVTAGFCAVFVPRLALAGAVIAGGIVVCDVGLVVSDFGGVTLSGAGLGLWLQVAALALGAGGAVCGLAAQPPGSLRPRPGPGPHVNRPIAGLTVVAAVLLGVALVPSWDRYEFVYRTVGHTFVVLAGNPFASGVSRTAAVGIVLSAFTFAAVPVVAVLVRPARAGVLLIVGVVTVACSQVLSAVVANIDLKLSGFYTPTFTRQDAVAVGAVVHGSLTVWFDVEVLAAVALLVLVAARWWTPSGGSLFDSYPVDVMAPAALSPTVWIYGSTAVSPPGTIGYGAVSLAGPPAGSHRAEPEPGPDPQRAEGPAAEAGAEPPLPPGPLPPPSPATPQSPPGWPG